MNKMEITEIINMVGEIGFMGAICIAMFIALMREQKNHKDEVTQMIKAIDNNTSVLERLLQLMRKE